MGLIKHVTKGNIVKILVNSQDEVKELLDVLIEGVFYEINFFNIKSLSAKIILKLHKLKNNLVLVVNEVKLKYYLRSLGFELKYKQKYKVSRAKKIDKIQYIALGGSAGSLKKFRQIINSLPPSDLTLFIIMHQRSDSKSSLAEILQRETKDYEVIQASSDMKVMPSTIYIAPPAQHMIVAGGFIFLTDDEPKHFSKPSISTTFESLAYEYKQALLTIIVCGYGADGSDSLYHIRKNGGTVIIEQLYECQATPMLENAIYSKEYDFILSIDDISKLLYEKFAQKDNINIYLDKFLEDIYNIYGYDYRNYHREHILRRVEHFYNMLKFNNFIDFKNKVLEDVEIFKDMFLNISINVTTFFRNPSVYKELYHVLEKLKDKNSIKIWCAGCSSGEEPYSIAIILKELGLLDKSLIYATDLNEIILQSARNGIYATKSYKLFYEHYKEMGGREKFENYFYNYDDFVMVDDEIKEKILFFKHNLATDGILNEFQLIFCRNVIIYFDEVLKETVFNLFDNSLDNNGILVLGESESLDNRKNFKVVNQVGKIYEKVSV